MGSLKLILKAAARMYFPNPVNYHASHEK